VAGPESALVSGDYGHLVAELQAEAARAGAANLTRMGSILAEARRAMRFSPEPRLVLELALVRLAALPDAVDLRALVEKLSALPPAPAPAPAARAHPAPGRPNPGAARQLSPDPQPSEPAPRSPSPESRTPAPAAADQWPAVRAAVAERQPSLGRLLERCRSAELSGGVLRLNMSPGSSFTIEQLEQADKRRVLEEEAARVLGAPVELAFRMAGAPAGRPGASAPRRPAAAEKTPAAPPAASRKSAELSQAAEQPAVRKLLGKFDGQVIDVRPKKP
jgi:DNA polymerase-3 subunit gamma/tau